MTQIIDEAKKVMLSKLVKLATQRENREKATLSTMIAIVEKYGSLEAALDMVNENDEFDFGKIACVVTMLCQQEDPDITEEQVRQNLDMSTLPEAMILVREWINLEVPDEIQARIEEAAAQSGAEEPKNASEEAQTQ